MSGAMNLRPGRVAALVVQSHGPAHILHGGAGHNASPVSACIHDVAHDFRVADVGLGTLEHRLLFLQDGVDHRLLAFKAADAGSAAAVGSGEVTAISAAVTPFMVAYGDDHPAIYSLALLPVYDAVARVKTRGHWQSDVLVGAAIGTGVGLWAAHRQSPLIIGWLPGGFQVGFVHHFKP